MQAWGSRLVASPWQKRGKEGHHRNISSIFPDMDYNMKLVVSLYQEYSVSIFSMRSSFVCWLPPTLVPIWILQLCGLEGFGRSCWQLGAQFGIFWYKVMPQTQFNQFSSLAQLCWMGDTMNWVNQLAPGATLYDGTLRRNNTSPITERIRPEDCHYQH